MWDGILLFIKNIVSTIYQIGRESKNARLFFSNLALNKNNQYSTKSMAFKLIETFNFKDADFQPHLRKMLLSFLLLLFLVRIIIL